MQALIKLSCVSLVSIFALAACATKNGNSSTEAASTAHAPKYEVSNLPGKVASIAADSATNSTLVTVNFRTGCGFNLLNVQSSLVKGEAGKNDTLYVDATSEVQSSGINCFAIRLEPKTITLPGQYTDANLDVEFLQGNSVSAPKDLAAAYPLTGAKILKISSLCPEGAMCEIGGTRLTLMAPLSACLAELGPVVAKVTKTDGNDAAQIVFGGVSLERAAAGSARCMAIEMKTFEVELPFQFFATAELVLMK